ncbi:hypothetical protein [Pyrococcus sp. NA2]|uniref:hypothetical protein n=1 Tax=Pyrococcus sp. (strain NA2) TaxID=342949 RepID=UPI0011D2348C|nr:hypothetical protein [Pyrococcus sp. NA2]
MLEDVIKDIEIEIKKFQERVAVLEEVSLLGESSISSKYKDLLKKRNYGFYYLIFLVVILIVELAVLMFLKSRYGFRLSGLTYVLLAILASLSLVILASMFRPREEDSLEDKILMYKSIVRFYGKLKESLERNDKETIQRLADEILEEPILAKALEFINVGEPKVIAYALYLYANEDKVEKSEIQEVIPLVRGPIRRLLESSVGGGHED